MSNRTLIKGTLILTITGLLTKLLGFYNRIFLTRLIGVKELGIYQLIFPLYILCISISCQGIATTITKQVSYAIGKKDTLAAKKILYLGLTISICISLCISLLLYRNALFISRHILKNESCYELIKIASIAIPFVSIKACLNAYFLGKNIPNLQGYCQLFEQIIRISAAYFLSISYMKQCIDAKMAFVAVVIGEISAMLFSLIYATNKKHQITMNSHNTYKVKLSQFVSDMIPMSLNNIMFNLFSSLEAIILPSYLFLYYKHADTSLEIYGTITGIVIPFLLFPATITTALATILLPNISYSYAQNDLVAIKKALTRSAFFCILLGIGTAIIYSIFGTFICGITFHSLFAGRLLSKMAIICPVLYLSTTLSMIMNALNLAFCNLMYNIIGIMLRICFIVFLVPKNGVTMYILGMFISYAIITFLFYCTINNRLQKDTTCSFQNH